MVAEAKNSTMEDPVTFKNTILSWECVRTRKKWHRCLDKVSTALLYCPSEPRQELIIVNVPSDCVVCIYLCTCQ